MSHINCQLNYTQFTKVSHQIFKCIGGEREREAGTQNQPQVEKGNHVSFPYVS